MEIKTNIFTGKSTENFKVKMKKLQQIQRSELNTYFAKGCL